jgi:hypothetical protein
MAKITLADGMVIEGTIEELRQMGVKFPVEDEPKIEPLKVGDYAKVISEPGHYQNGTVVKLVSFGNYSGNFDTENLDGSSGDIHLPEQLVRATGEEVAKAKAKLAEKKLTEKWASIGRKINEFKEGDFVKYKKCFAEVTRVGIYDMSIEAPNGIIQITFESAKLVMPVESRFDH